MEKILYRQSYSNNTATQSLRPVASPYPTETKDPPMEHIPLAASPTHKEQDNVANIWEKHYLTKEKNAVLQAMQDELAKSRKEVAEEAARLSTQASELERQRLEEAALAQQRMQKAHEEHAAKMELLHSALQACEAERVELGRRVEAMPAASAAHKELILSQSELLTEQQEMLRSLTVSLTETKAEKAAADKKIRDLQDKLAAATAAPPESIPNSEMTALVVNIVRLVAQLTSSLGDISGAKSLDGLCSLLPGLVASPTGAMSSRDVLGQLTGALNILQPMLAASVQSPRTPRRRAKNSSRYPDQGTSSAQRHDDHIAMDVMRSSSPPRIWTSGGLRDSLEEPAYVASTRSRRLEQKRSSSGLHSPRSTLSAVPRSTMSSRNSLKSRRCREDPYLR